MPAISYEKFLEVFSLIPCHSECEFCFFDVKETYMLIKYENNVSFQRCGYSVEMIEEYNLQTDHIGSGEEFYNNFEELCTIKAVDGICLKDMWDSIEGICINSSFVLPNEIDDLYSIYGEKNKNQ